MNKAVLDILIAHNTCNSSRKIITRWDTITEGWEDCNRGVLMVGLISLLKMCEFKDTLKVIASEAQQVFTNFYSEAVALRAKKSIESYYDVVANSKDCKMALEALHGIVTMLVYSHLPEGVDSIVGLRHISINEKTLSDIVRKHIPAITDEMILSRNYSEGA